MPAAPSGALQSALDGGVDYTAFLVKLGIFAVAFAATYVVGRAVAVPVVDRVLSSEDITPTVRRPARKFVRAAVIFVAFFSGLFFARLETLLSVTGSLAAALTLAVGFASRDILGNLVGGLFIISDPKFNLGDWIEWGDSEGIIEDISFRVTRVRTFRNELITVPNSVLASSIVTNHAIKDTLRIDFRFGMEYGVDVDAVTEALVDEAESNPDVLDDPEPVAQVTEVTAAGVDFAARVWIAEPSRAKYLSVRADYIGAVKERFDRDDLAMSGDLIEVTGNLETSGAGGPIGEATADADSTD